MDTSFNWLQLRGLGALAALGIFLVYAVLAGWRQERTTDRRGSQMVKQDPRGPAKQPFANSLDRRAA